MIIVGKREREREMRMSCNGCRVLRKGCSEDCIIRPCLDWIKNPDSQANATVFLAKFYGRAGLLNLLTAVPHHQRLSVFRSLLYESCGRTVNPIYGSVGLQWNGKWHLCQAAVDAVLQGKPIVPISSSSGPTPSSKSFDTRHVAKRDIKPTINMVSKCSGTGDFKNGTMEENQLIDLKLSLSPSQLAESGGMEA